ncbi:MAG: hypothetical protein AAGF92_24195, partial [Myxococcota bacterium]
GASVCSDGGSGGASGMSGSGGAGGSNVAGGSAGDGGSAGTGGSGGDDGLGGDGGSGGLSGGGGFGGTGECHTGLTECSGECVNLLNDTQHCGACDSACGPNSVCDGSTCTLICQVNETRCAGPPEYCTVLNTMEDCGSCGNVCELTDACTMQSCQACVPMAATSSGLTPPGAIPAGLYTNCTTLAGTPTSTCPILTCNAVTYWFFSYADNRFSLAAVGYDADGNIVSGPIETAGLRRIADITVDEMNETITLTGQIGFTAVMDFSEIHLP